MINIDGAAQLDGPAHPLLAALDQAGRQVGVPLRAGAMASDNLLATPLLDTTGGCCG